MTGLLSDVMHDRADTAGHPVVDLDAIVRVGDRRLRRNRAVSGLAVAAVVLAAAAGSVTAMGLLDLGDDLAADAPPTDPKAALAIGDQIHVGARTFDVGRPVASLVQTDDGLVYTTTDDTVWLYDGETSVEVGRADGNRLRADDAGSLVSWVALAEDGHPQYVVFDTSSRRELARVDNEAAGPSKEPSDEGAEVFAVDDGSVYWRDGFDIVRYDVASGQETTISSRIDDLVDVAGGRFAYAVDGRDVGNGRWGIAVGPQLDPGDVSLAEASHGYLSPDGRLLAAEESDSIAVYATDDGQDLTPQVNGYEYVVSYGWVADDVASVLALSSFTEEAASGDILECDVSDDACTVVTSFHDVATDRLVLPTGDPNT
ncbi:MAG: hypothetical protein WBQ50_04635 [Nocardioides sp.]